MSLVPYQSGETTYNIATTDVTRDGVTEKVELIQVFDPVSGYSLTLDASGHPTVNIAGTVPVSLTFPTTQPVSGTVAVSNQPVTDASTATATVATNFESPIIVKNSAGKLCRAIVTGLGSQPLFIYDNSTGVNTGTIIGIIIADVVVGEPIEFYMPAEHGISIPVQANTPSATLSFY